MGEPQQQRRDRILEGRPQPRHRRHADRSWSPNARWGAYSTVSLVHVARRMRHRGVRPKTIDERVYAPFPVAGLAAWADTWGAPRYAGGYHPHHGQDLMCAEGTPLLAVQPGTVETHIDPLGGTTIFLVRPDGSFWYYAHLARYANGIADGEHVRTGQRIGLCGASGDASVSHLHFAFFTPSGEAINPMRDLISWLHDAERTSGLAASTGRGVHLPKAFREHGDAGSEPAVVTATVRPTRLWLATGGQTPYAAPSQLVVAPGSGGTGVGLVVGATLLLLPLPLLSRRVRAGVWQLRRASRSP